MRVKNMRFLLVVFIALVAISFQAAATDSSGNHAVWGKGKQSCFAYSQARENGDASEFKDFMMGYLTATNVMMEKTYSISGKMNLKTILEWVDEYCEEQPMSSYESALTEFTMTHYKQRYKNNSGSSW